MVVMPAYHDRIYSKKKIEYAAILFIHSSICFAKINFRSPFKDTHFIGFVPGSVNTNRRPELTFCTNRQTFFPPSRYG